MNIDLDSEEMKLLDWFAVKAMPMVDQINTGAVKSYVSSVLSALEEESGPYDQHDLFKARACGIAFYAYEMAEAMLLARSAFLLTNEEEEGQG